MASPLGGPSRVHHVGLHRIRRAASSSAPSVTPTQLSRVPCGGLLSLLIRLTPHTGESGPLRVTFGGVSAVKLSQNAGAGSPHFSPPAGTVVGVGGCPVVVLVVVGMVGLAVVVTGTVLLVVVVGAAAHLMTSESAVLTPFDRAPGQETMLLPTLG